MSILWRLKIPHRFELLVFDWDGTLMDSTAVIAGALQSACADIGLPVPADERARHVIGLGLYDALRYILPGVPPSIYPQVVDRYRHHFVSREQSAPLFAGAEQTLRALQEKGHYLAVATGKSRRGLDRVLARTGLASVFHATRCGEEAASKPAPDMLLELHTVLGIDKSKTLMIGDTTHDLQMAKNAGITGVAVAFGAHPAQQLRDCDPLECFVEPHELWAWLIKHA